MLKEYEKPLTLEPHSSHLLKSYLLTVHVLSLCAVIYASIGFFLKVLCIAFIVLHFYYLIKKLNRSLKVIWLDENNWRLFNNKNIYIAAYLTPWTFMSSWLVILVFKTEYGKTVSVCLPYDAVDNERFRSLKQRITILKPKYLSQKSLREG